MKYFVLQQARWRSKKSIGRPTLHGALLPSTLSTWQQERLPSSLMLPSGRQLTFLFTSKFVQQKNICNLKYCKVPLVSPELVQLRNGFLRRLMTRGPYIQGGLPPVKKKMCSQLHQQKTTLTLKLVFSLSTHNLLVFKISFCFTSLQALDIMIMTGVGGINRRDFLLPDWCPYNRGGGGGGLRGGGVNEGELWGRQKNCWA